MRDHVVKGTTGGRRIEVLVHKEQGLVLVDKSPNDVVTRQRRIEQPNVRLDSNIVGRVQEGPDRFPRHKGAATDLRNVVIIFAIHLQKQLELDTPDDFRSLPDVTDKDVRFIELVRHGSFKGRCHVSATLIMTRASEEALGSHSRS